MSAFLRDAIRRAEEVGSLIGAERLTVLWNELQQREPLAGDVVELGVYKGGSAVLLQAAAPQRRLHLFDTFTGHPVADRRFDDPNAHPVGRFSDTSLQDVVRLFASEARLAEVAVELHSGVEFHAGVFPASAAAIGWGPPLVFAHVDADIFDSVHAACQIFWSLLVPGGVMVFDDYGFPDCPGAKLAVDRWSAAYNVPVRPLSTGQCLVFKEQS